MPELEGKISPAGHPSLPALLARLENLRRDQARIEREIREIEERVGEIEDA